MLEVGSEPWHVKEDKIAPKVWLPGDNDGKKGGAITKCNCSQRARVMDHPAPARLSVTHFVCYSRTLRND